MNWHDLIAPQSQAQYLVAAPEPDVGVFVSMTRHSDLPGIPVILRGERCRTRAALFDEWAAALQFPSYFGYNWDAFDEMVADLDWLPAPAYVFFVTNTDEVLQGDEAAFSILTSILANVSRTGVRTDKVYGREPAPLRVVYHCEPAQYDAVRLRLERAQAPFVPASLDPPI